MTAFLHLGLLILSIIMAYIWLQVPALRSLSLQAFVTCIALYLGLKRLHKAQIWHLAPTSLPLEMSLINFTFLLIIGFTGGVNSVLFPLTYILLFFLIFTNRLTVSLVTTLFILLFFYVQTDIVSQHNLSSLATIPLLFTFLAFAKAQYQQASRDQVQLNTDAALLDSYQHSQLQLSSFMTSFIQPKLEFISTLLEYPVDNKQALQSQLALLQVEIEKMLNRVRPDKMAVSQTVLESEVTVSNPDLAAPRSLPVSVKTTATTMVTHQTTITHADISEISPSA